MGDAFARLDGPDRGRLIEANRTALALARGFSDVTRPDQVRAARELMELMPRQEIELVAVALASMLAAWTRTLGIDWDAMNDVMEQRMGNHG